MVILKQIIIITLKKVEKGSKTIASEKRVVKFTRGQKKFVWVKKTARNEALDTMVYAIAALHIIQPNYEKIKINIDSDRKTSTTNLVSQRASIKRRNNWVNNW